MSDELIVERHGALVDYVLPMMVAREGMPIHMCPSTLPVDPAGVIRRMNATGQSSLELDRDGSLLMYVADVLAYPREKLDEDTGEVKRFSWLVLIDPQGETWGTSSEVVASKITQVVGLWSAGLLKRPIGVQIVTRTARRSGQRYHDVLLIGE